MFLPSMHTSLATRSACRWEMKHVLFARRCSTPNRCGRSTPTAARRVGWAEMPYHRAQFFANVTPPCRARVPAYVTLNYTTPLPFFSTALIPAPRQVATPVTSIVCKTHSPGSLENQMCRGRIYVLTDVHRRMWNYQKQHYDGEHDCV